VGRSSENWGNNKEKHSGANHWHHACLTKLLGEVQEEERGCYETQIRSSQWTRPLFLQEF
jgi:hypothetical protein